ncbi:MAG: hypothetical protein NTV51_06970, partial [Verrucomicrobia bacterium]|nr:hypothetical protein [Verrucomicrobiota bacterium]
MFGLVLSVATACGQSFSITPNTIAITAAAGINPLPTRVPITYSPASYDLTKLTVTSDAPWVTPTVDAATGSLVLSFTAADLVKRTYTATLTLADGTRTAQAFVQATVSPLSITRLVADPTRSRVYAVQQDGLNPGAVLVYDPVQSAYLGSFTVGSKPCDLAVSPDGTEMLVICSASKSITVVDLTTLRVRDTIALASYTEWGVADTSAHVAYGPGTIMYYSDGAWAPKLSVFDRTARTVTQNLSIEPSASDGYGWGGFVLAPDRSAMYGWAQYGWSAGLSNSFLARFGVAADGRLTSQAVTKSVALNLQRDPLNTPAMISADGKLLVAKQLVVNPAALTTTVQTTPTSIFAISPNAEILSTQSAIFSSTTGNKLFDLPVTSTVQAITADYSRLVYFNGTTKALGVVDLTKALSFS